MDKTLHEECCKINKIQACAYRLPCEHVYVGLVHKLSSSQSESCVQVATLRWRKEIKHVGVCRNVLEPLRDRDSACYFNRCGAELSQCGECAAVCSSWVCMCVRGDAQTVCMCVLSLHASSSAIHRGRGVNSDLILPK